MWRLWGIKGICPHCGSNNVEIGKMLFKLINHCGWCDFTEPMNLRK